MSRRMNIERGCALRRKEDLDEVLSLTHLNGQAERLIRYSDLSLEAIAAECGFGCYANYFKACKKARGVAPGRIAEEIRGE